jgi:CIC family chloride channel protein
MQFQKALRHLLSTEFWLRGKWFFLSIVIGIVAGLGAIVFQFLSQAVLWATLGCGAGYWPGETAGEFARFPKKENQFSPWILIGVLGAGGLASGLLVYGFAPEAEGHGTDAAIEAFHHKRGYIRWRVPIVKTLASAITIGTGGSGGREGPIAQIGAGFGSFLGTQLKLNARDRRIMLAAGMGAGVGAIFRAPLAGALFAGEILYRDADLESDVIIPAAISSIIAYSVYCLSLPAGKQFTPLFGEHLGYALDSPFELILYGLMSLVLVAVGIVYIKTFYGTHDLFKKLRVPRALRPAIGASAAGVLALVLLKLFHGDMRTMAVLSTGYGSLQEAVNVDGNVGIQLLLAIAIVKIATTSLTIGSGGSGGVFGPSMVIGGCLGGAIGRTFHTFWPEVVRQPQAYAIVGMAGFFAGCAHAPISTIIMVSEMTGDYKLLLPTMWVSTLCFLLCRRWTLYSKQLPSLLDSPAHAGDLLVDLLEGIRVSDVVRPLDGVTVIPEAMPLEKIIRVLTMTQQSYFPVIDSEGRMIGIFSANDLRAYLYKENVWQLAIARDIMIADVASVTPEDDLNTAMRQLTARNLDELPVIDPKEPGKLIGMLRHKDTIAVYNQRLMEHKQLVAE